MSRGPKAIEKLSERYYPRHKGHVINTIPGMENYISTGMVSLTFYGWWYEYKDPKGNNPTWIIGDLPDRDV